MRNLSPNVTDIVTRKTAAKTKASFMYPSEIERRHNEHRKERIGGERKPRKEGVQDRVVVQLSDEVGDCIIKPAEIH
jgi:hypothetical protein